MLALSERSTNWRELDPRAAELVKLRFFAGLTRQQAAESSASPSQLPTAIGLTPSAGSRCELTGTAGSETKYDGTSHKSQKIVRESAEFSH